MIKFKFTGLISLFFLLLFQTSIAQQNQQNLKIVKQSVDALTDVMIYDITSPPVASRNYAYSLIAFYEAVAVGSKTNKSLAGILNGFKPISLIEQGVKYNWLLAGSTAFYKTAYAFVFSKDQFQKNWAAINLQLNKTNISADVRARSIAFGEQVAEHIIQWAKEDGFAKTRTLPRYTPGKQPGNWQPTGPDYMEAVEPYWNMLRPMILTKADESVLPAPAPFKSDKFLEECKEVYTVGKNISIEQRAITNFWDCNPFATETVGHLIYSVKKISPAGHWIGITGIIVKQKKQSLVAALYAYSLVSVVIFDVIIAAWGEKYRTNYIRPVTAIQQLISPTWEPILQTPPFPEYPSGHSVISIASAIILTHLFGDNFHYVDDVEKPFGLPARAFKSFSDAANEAAISRLYGGIHFRESLENGKIMGRYVANKMLAKIRVNVAK